MKTKMILKKGIVFLFAIMMALTGIFSLGVMAASGLEGAYISPKSKMGLEFANNFDRSVSKSQVSVPNFMADSDTNSEEPNKSFNAQQVAAGNSDAGAKWRGFAAYAKNHDPEDFWVRYKDVTTVGGKSVDLKIEVTDWKTQNDESKPLPSSADMFGHDNNSAHLGYAIGFSYKKTGVVMFSGFKWVKFKYTFLYNGTNTKAPFTGFATFQDIDQNQYVTITDGMDNIVNTSYIGGSDGNTWCEPDGWTYKAIKDQNASSDQDSFDKTCISLYVKDMTDMSIKYGWTGHTAIAYFDLAPWAMNSFEENKNPDVPKKLIQNGGSWISNEKTSAVNYELGDTYSYRYEDSIPDYASDTLEKLRNQSQTAVSPFKKLAEIDDKVHWKNKEGLTQEEWDAPITHTKFTVTYEAKINKEPADTNQFVNVATAKGSNTDEVKDDEIVYLKTPVIKVEKESDKDSYQKGETAKYHLTVTQTREDRTAVNVVIKDALKDEDSEKERIKGDTIKVYYNGNEFTPVSVKSDDTSFTIETGKNLTVKDKLEVTYDAEVLSDLNKDSITNIVKAKADNAYAEIELDVPVTKVTQNISARKTSNPASGTVVKQGGQIVYYIDVHNDSDTTLKNVLVRDAVPELSSYIEGSASNNGKIMEINGKQYVTYVIDTLRAGSTQTLSFAVTVDEKATSEDVILNTAEIKETTEKDLNEDGNIPDDLWNEDFKETNTTKHPLSNWATDIKTVKVGTPDSYIEKRADSAVYDVGETIHYTIVAEQTTKDGKLTNAVVEDKDLPDGVDIDYDSIKVDGNTVPEQDTMTSDTNSIYLIRTKKGFKVVYPELSEKSTITFDAVIKSEKLVGKKIPNKATIISDQTPEKEAVVNVKVPKNPVEKVIKKIINRKGVSGNSSPKGVKTGLSTHTGLFAGIAAALLAAAAILIKKRRNAKKKPMTLEKF